MVGVPRLQLLACQSSKPSSSYQPASGTCIFLTGPANLEVETKIMKAFKLSAGIEIANSHAPVEGIMLYTEDQKTRR